MGPMNLPNRKPLHDWTERLCAVAGECDGQDLIEYCLLIAVVALGSVVALAQFQNVIGNIWSTFSNSLNGGS